MIKNERQYRITRAQAAKFELALAGSGGPAISEDVHPLVLKAQSDAIRSQLEDLRFELTEYEALRDGKVAVLEAQSWDELPEALVKARIASGLTQQELADRLGVKWQQVQRYEATDYAGASLDRIKSVISALGIIVREDVFLTGESVSTANLLRKLASFGIDRDFVMNRLLPPKLASAIQAGASRDTDSAIALKAASTIGRVFGFSPSLLFGANTLRLATSAAGSVRYKVAANAETTRLSAYTVYAHYLGLLTLDVTSAIPVRTIPRAPSDVRKELVESYGGITLESVLRYIWDLGVPVLPLCDSGAFHGACWRSEGRNVIVLKQRTQSPARWIVDALHELFHAGQEPLRDSFAYIEANTISAIKATDEEHAAVEYSGDIVLDGRAEELAEMCVKEASGRVDYLKAALPKVSKREGIGEDALANYMAYRLSLQGINWWPTANGFQTSGSDPWKIARDLFVRRSDLQKLSPPDCDILIAALREHVTH